MNSKIKAAFDNLMKVIEDETMEKFDKLEQQARGKRLDRLQKDLDELKKRENEQRKEAFKDFKVNKI